MNIHNNARLPPKGRENLVNLVSKGLTIKSVAQRLSISVRTVSKWVGRYKLEGVAGLQDRSSRPNKLYRPTQQKVIEQIVNLRRQRLTGKHIARLTRVSAATVSRVLKRVNLSRMKDLEPKEPERRYCYEHAGDMIHIDIKKFGRFTRPGHRIMGSRKDLPYPRATKLKPRGWEYLHVCIDDATRIAFTDIYPNEKKETAVAFLEAAIEYYKKLGISVNRVMTDNGGCYRSNDFRDACKRLGLKHVRTKPYTPRTNGKAERFIQTAIREWAYARKYQTSDLRKETLPSWTHMYNWHRPHGGINDKTPISKVDLNRNNLLTIHS
ncbi:MAG: IS481 family transposase [Hyphomicrobiales bacterium]|nr:MAG: IS481 family transposase [Hyphomicrobiales bacterium]